MINLEEINVYVVDLEQPFENWFGVLKKYDLIKGTCTVEDNKGTDVELFLINVIDVNTDLPVKSTLLKLICKDSLLKFLIESNLSAVEAELFYTLSKKIYPRKEELDFFYEEMESGIPFEGGMCATEAIIALTEDLKMCL